MTYRELVKIAAEEDQFYSDLTDAQKKRYEQALARLKGNIDPNKRNTVKRTALLGAAVGAPAYGILGGLAGADHGGVPGALLGLAGGALLGGAGGAIGGALHGKLNAIAHSDAEERALRSAAREIALGLA